MIDTLDYITREQIYYLQERLNLPPILTETLEGVGFIDFEQNSSEYIKAYCLSIMSGKQDIKVYDNTLLDTLTMFTDNSNKPVAKHIKPWHHSTSKSHKSRW